jgi:type IV pilus assembly protein PilA
MRHDNCMSADRLRRRRQRGFSLIELLIVVAIILILAAIAVPKLNQNKMLAHETAAIQQIGTIQSGQTQYYSQFGKYAQNLTELGPPPSGAAGPSAADLIPGDLSLGKKTGYVFTLQQAPTGYTITAVPEAFGNTGRRTFYADQTLVIRQNWTAEPPTATSPELK